MRLVTYDRRGHRRLGALLGDGDGAERRPGGSDRVVDLPDLVGHPAFPGTLEGLVSSNGGTVMDAARAALARDDAQACVVPGARLLPPVLPASLRSPGADEAVRRIAGPGDEIAWPEQAGWLTYEPKIAAVLGRPAEGLDAEAARGVVFGYTLVSDWTVRDASGNPRPSADTVPVSIGPYLVTADEIEPQTTYMTVRVDGEQWAKGNLNGAAVSLMRVIAVASGGERLRPGDSFASSPFRDFGAEPARQLWPGATVELEAEELGTLRNRIAPRDAGRAGAGTALDSTAD